MAIQIDSIIYRKERNLNFLFSFYLLCILLVSGCVDEKKTSDPAALKEIHPGILQGYLTSEDLPNSLELIPPPPTDGSAAFALDQEISEQSMEMHEKPRWDQATKDAILAFPEAVEAFSDVVDVPITEKDTPHLYILLRRSLTDAGLSTYSAKNHYVRKRPFMLNKNPVCTPEDEELLRKDGSYPSGHTAIGWAWALILCEIHPEKTNAIIARGREFGESRMICNVHWQSDVNEGRFMGAATVARLHADPVFLADLAVAKSEVAELQLKK